MPPRPGTAGEAGPRALILGLPPGPPASVRLQRFVASLAAHSAPACSVMAACPASSECQGDQQSYQDSDDQVDHRPMLLLRERYGRRLVVMRHALVGAPAVVTDHGHRNGYRPVSAAAARSASRTSA